MPQEDLKNRSSKKRYHHHQIKRITEKFDFDCFIDCGIGYVGSESWSVKDILPACTIIGFEPHLKRFEMISEQKFPGRLYNAAVGETSRDWFGFTGIEDNSDFKTSLSEYDASIGKYKNAKVNMLSIDDVLEDFPDCKKIFIWADIEGAELKMLKGCKKTFESNKIVGLNLELRDFKVDQFCTAEEVTDFLSKQNFNNITGRITRGPRDYLFKKNK